MTKITAFIAAAALAASAGFAMAGGPVVIVDEDEPTVFVPPGFSAGGLAGAAPLALGAIAVVAALAGGSDSTTVSTPAGL